MKTKILTRRDIAVMREYLKVFPPEIAPALPIFDVKRISKTLSMLSDRVDFLEMEKQTLQEERDGS